MSKYKKQVEEMLEVHADVFKSFRELHDKYAENPQKWQKQFNEEGEDVLLIIQRWDNNLCAKSEGGKYGKFSQSLSDKFWEEVRKLFPKLGYVGLES